LYKCPVAKSVEVMKNGYGLLMWQTLFLLFFCLISFDLLFFVTTEILPGNGHKSTQLAAFTSQPVVCHTPTSCLPLPRRWSTTAQLVDCHCLASALLLHQPGSNHQISFIGRQMLSWGQFSTFARFLFFVSWNAYLYSLYNLMKKCRLCKFKFIFFLANFFVRV
jgi:hypothetical protein